jgi:outer membrane protein assembly factor BamB
VGMLRVKQAMAEGNAIDVQAATVQFYGTDAAAEAHLWLGDRALASGDFPHALGHYQHLLTSGLGLGGRQAQISARVRLAGALLGREVGQAVTESVDLGGTSFTPADFEALVADLRTNRTLPGSAGTAAVAGESSARGQGQAPAPARFEAKQWTRFAGSQGAGGNPPLRIGDWAGQQVSSLIVGDRMIVSNRLEVMAFDLAGGQQRWNRQVGGNAGKAQDWPGVAMTPVLAGEKLLVRWVAKNGPEVVALDAKRGDILWAGRTGGYVLCDPFVVQDQVHMLVASDLQNKILQVNFVTLDLRNGQMIAQRPVVQFRDVWNRQIPCQAVLVDDKVVATLGGTELCVNLLGHPQWLRRQSTIPMSLDYRWHEQGQDPPVVSRGLVFAAQPGVREVTCLDLETGRMRWQRAMPQLVRVSGMVDGRLIVRTTEGIEALAAADGKLLWQADVPNLLVAQLLPGAKADPAGAGRSILVACSELADAELQWRVRLSWLDPATGREIARRPLVDLVHKVPQFGPLVAHENRLWGFFRKSPDPTHEIFELTADGEIPRLSPSDAVTQLPAAWRRELTPQIRETASDLFPGWELIEGFEERQAGYRKEWQGGKDVLVATATPGRGVTFTRQVTIPAGSKARLALKVGHDSADKWSIDVRVGTTTLASQRIEGETTANGWKEWQVDLAPYAGKTVWLVVEQRGVEAARVNSYWKQLEITN